MNINTSLTGGLAVGAALTVLLTHGKDYSVEEIGALAAGLGTTITYLVKLGERILDHYLPRPPQPEQAPPELEEADTST